MILFPSAKINLGLNVVRRRPDGYHDIETVMIPVPWCDILEIVPADNKAPTLHLTGNAVDCPPEKNLVMKALHAMEKAVGHPLPVEIYLHKIIPDGAGMGGGSADAAFMLRGLNELFELGMDNSRLAEIAATIGADCSFFIYNTPAFCTGIGTDILPLGFCPAQGCAVAIAKPRVSSVSTAAAYAGITPTLPEYNPMKIVALPPDQWRGVLTNDFEPVISAILPEVKTIKDAFYNTGALYAAMTGSGSAVFGIYANDSLAQMAVASLEECDTHVAIIDKN